MNRRQKKLEQKRKKRDLAKKKARAQAARKPRPEVLIAGAAARAPFGPCYVSAGWDDEEVAHLVTVVVTRRLPDSRLVAATALVDRTCLGIKDANVDGPMDDEELEELLELFSEAHGAMEECELLRAQSIVFHALDYALRLGFPPHRDFDERLFAPRPAELTATPWGNEERPLYVLGPHDDVEGIITRLDAAVGTENYDIVDPMEGEEGDDEDVIDVEAVEKPAEP